MEKVEAEQPEFLQELAALVAVWMPDLKGRAVAVTDAEITKENRPPLPFAQLALNREEAKHFPNTNKQPDLSDDFIIEIWLELKKYKDSKSGAETPWWAYYPYEKIRDRLLSKLWKESLSRENWGIRYISMDVSSDAGAVVLTFRFSRNYTWCPDDEEDDGVPIDLSFKACPAINTPAD